MKRDGEALSKTEKYFHTALFGSLWLIGVAACLAVAWMLICAEPSRENYARMDRVERWIEPLSDVEFAKSGFARLARRVPDFTKAHWESVALPDVHELPLRSSMQPGGPISQAWFRFHYTVPADVTPEMPLVVYGTRIMGGGAYTVWANGHLVMANLDDWRMQWNHPLFVALPLGVARAGDTVEVMLAFPFRELQGYSVGSLYFGEAHALQHARDVRVFFQRTLPFIIMILGVLMGLLSFQFWLARRDEKVHGVLAVASIAWFVCNLQFTYDFSENDMVSLWFGQIVDASFSWMLLLVFIFAFRLGKRRHPKIESAFAGYVLLNTLVTLPNWNWQVNALLLQHWVLFCVASAVAIYMAIDAFRDRRIETVVLSGSVCALIGFGGYDISFMTSQTRPDQIFLAPYGTILVFFAFVFATQRRYLDALTVAENANLTLSKSLEDREQELHVKHQELMAIEQRQTIFLERQRLVRDMHDGIGSSLMSSLVVAEGRNIDPTQVARVLRECLDDLKLVIESLEPMEQDLTTLLGALRHRFDYRLEASGLELQWEMGDLPPLPWLDAPEALQILRIVQEVISNILKHAQASRIQISANIEPGSAGHDHVLVRIADDGVGFDMSIHRPGHGLKNMQERAGAIGAILRVISAPGAGTSVELRLPVDVR